MVQNVTWKIKWSMWLFIELFLKLTEKHWIEFYLINYSHRLKKNAFIAYMDVRGNCLGLWTLSRHSFYFQCITVLLIEIHSQRLSESATAWWQGPLLRPWVVAIRTYCQPTNTMLNPSSDNDELSMVHWTYPCIQIEVSLI